MINWKIRFKNKTFIASLIALCVAFVFDLCALLGVTLPVGQEAVLNAVNAILTVLGMLGVIVDPTTKGIGDSKLSLSKTELTE